jgi:pimeloyl-ACP methyl ester carboxylesterase
MTSRPQEPTEPYPYLVEGISLTPPMAGITLAGTLSRPTHDQATTAVLLIPGSGAQDRDEHICGHRPFVVLADHLTRAGVTVLRLDDRGVGDSTGRKDECSHEDLLADVETALAFLSRHPAVDSRRVGLLGHSEGALIAAATAARFADVAFLTRTWSRTRARRRSSVPTTAGAVPSRIS